MELITGLLVSNGRPQLDEWTASPGGPDINALKFPVKNAVCAFRDVLVGEVFQG